LPELEDPLVVEVLGELICLGCSIFSSARKEIQISHQASRFCILSIFHGICVHRSEATVPSDYCQALSRLLHAGKGDNWISNINAQAGLTEWSHN
jgi:hypothetical protein